MKSLEASQAAFEDLAAFYEQNYMIEPKCVDGRKVAGLRSRRNLIHQMRALRAAAVLDEFNREGKGDDKVAVH